MINRVCLTGRLTKDVDLSYTPQGSAKAQFTLAVNRAFANQSGDRRLTSSKYKLGENRRRMQLTF